MAAKIPLVQGPTGCHPGLVDIRQTDRYGYLTTLAGAALGAFFGLVAGAGTAVVVMLGETGSNASISTAFNALELGFFGIALGSVLGAFGLLEVMGFQKSVQTAIVLGAMGVVLWVAATVFAIWVLYPAVILAPVLARLIVVSLLGRTTPAATPTA